ncbi:hypothetical protein [Nocardia sp. MH4]|uniref:hypothetical protein n=1 Tax=Nocardia sp. MH4 TaxID=1768677 RepID=UPI001C4FE286|nr:hypothetical protein [Nocardia sp. MH4]
MATTMAFLKRVVVPTALVALAGTALAVAINKATGSDAQWWWWLIVAALTVAWFGASLFLYLRQSAATPSGPVATGERSVAFRGTVMGSISTGDTGTSTPPAPASAPGVEPPPPGSANALGYRSVAAEGSVGGDLSTGDHA